MRQPTRDQIFISYSHKDYNWLERLQTMLKPLMREKLAVWDDTKIKAGAKWKDEIQDALAAAKVAVLLVSPDFLASDFIAANELPPLLKAAEKEGLAILWVYVSSCLYKETEIKDYQAAHDVAKPLNLLTLDEQDDVLVAVSRKILAAAEGSAKKRTKNETWTDILIGLLAILFTMMFEVISFGLSNPELVIKLADQMTSPTEKSRIIEEVQDKVLAVQFDLWLISLSIVTGARLQQAKVTLILDYMMIGTLLLMLVLGFVATILPAYKVFIGLFLPDAVGFGLLFATARTIRT